MYAKSDERLTELARAGSPAAFEAIVMRYRRALVRHCASVLGEGDAEEAVQEALIKADVALRRGEQVRALAPWLYTITHRVALNLLRARASHPPTPSGRPPRQIGPYEHAEQRENLRDTLAALQLLPLRQRRAIVMLVLEGRSYEEIATRLGATPRAVSQLLNRARSSLHDGARVTSARQSGRSRASPRSPREFPSRRVS